MSETIEKHLPQKGECWLPYDGYCCCQCRWLAEDYSHPMTDGKKCTEQRGFVCLSPEFEEDGVFHVSSGWPEHSSSCEMFTRRETPRKTNNREDNEQ
jgi:hypothetical protein